MRHTLVAPLYGFLRSLLLAFLRNQVPQWQVVDDILNVFDPVLQSIAFPPQNIVLKIQNLEASMDILDKLIDKKWTLIVSESDRVTRKTGLTRLVYKN